MRTQWLERADRVLHLTPRVSNVRPCSIMLTRAVLLVAVAMAWVSLPLAAAAKVSVASFNIQVFGTSKLSDAAVSNILVSIVNRYDVVAIMEIRDASETVASTFLDRINSAREQDDPMKVGF